MHASTSGSTGTSTSGDLAVVLLSGGLDSATLLAIAREEGYHCHALSFDYGQTHGAELAAARKVAAQFNVRHRILTIPIGSLGGSALTDASIPVPDQGGEGIPVTYVPARNTVFLALSLAWAEVLQARAIFIGVNALDYSGYPDCRPEYVAAFQELANLATRQAVEGAPVEVLAPLVNMTKAEIIQRGTELGVDYSMTVSCYRADPEGRACGRCDACRFRAQGFSQAGVMDPTRYQTQT
ncbi:MAG: 7-cyano-7-deazaguanine synthase QueC [Rhodospirillaceae bacterium]|nr:7-cyano-7-deazaguanine synthase QueC [Rhodospirillaceae bacterium]MDE0359663.1 7-cyano-7-deazaguanine synthase QueC [Rhodospirillaceae bacterium]